MTRGKRKIGKGFLKQPQGKNKAKNFCGCGCVPHRKKK